MNVVTEERQILAAWAEQEPSVLGQDVFVPGHDVPIVVEATSEKSSWGNDSLRSLAKERFLDYTKYRPTHFNAALARVVAHISSNHDHTVTVADDVTYGDVVGLRQQPDTLSPTPFRVLSAFARLWTADGKLLLLHRDSGDWSAGYELAGGFVRGSSKYGTLQDFIHTRVCSDTGLASEDIETVAFLGWWYAASMLECIGTFDVKLAGTYGEVKDSLGDHVVLPAKYTSLHIQNLDEDCSLHTPSKQLLLALADKLA